MGKADSKSGMNVQKTIIQGVCELIRHKPFYGHILQQLLKVHFNDSNQIESVLVPTMGVGKRSDEVLIKLYVNDSFVEDRVFGEAPGESEEDCRTAGWQRLCGVLEHEVLHIVFEHLTMDFPDQERGAYAVDMAVNSCIKPDRLPCDGVHAEDFGFPEHKSAFWYYQHLKDHPKWKQIAEAKGKMREIAEKIIQSHSMWGEALNDPVLGDYLRDVIRKARDLTPSDMWGDIPGEVKCHVDNVLERRKAIIPWNRVLRNFVASCQESSLSYTMKRESKRFGTRPGTKKEDVLKVAVAIDTSGSISDEQLKLFWNEIRWIHRNGAEVWVIECDTVVSDRSPFKFRGKWDGEVHGRGGTSLKPPLEMAEGKYDALIYFTDFYAAEVERKYNIPTLWVLTTELDPEQYPCKWGKHVKIQDGKAVPTPAA